MCAKGPDFRRFVWGEGHRIRGVSCEAADVAVTVTGGNGSRPPADDPEQSCVCFSYLYFLLNDLSHAGHLYMRSPTEWTSLRCLCILFRVVSTLQTIHLANFVFSGTTVHKPGIIDDEVILRSNGRVVFDAPQNQSWSDQTKKNFWRAEAGVSFYFVWNFEVRIEFWHYTTNLELYVWFSWFWTHLKM